MKRMHLKLAGTLCGVLCLTSSLLAQSIGQWDFNNGDLTQTTGANLGDLQYLDGAGKTTSQETRFATTANLGIPAISGTVANVMGFPAGPTNGVFTGYLMPTPSANGGGSLVNQYSVVMDVLFQSQNALRPLLEMDDASLDNIRATWDLGANNSLEVTNNSGARNLISGDYGTIATNTWYRLGMVMDSVSGKATVYTNGVLLGVLKFGASVDSPYTLEPNGVTRVLSSFTNAAGFVSSIQFRDSLMSPGTLEALGGPVATKIPVNLPAEHSYIVSRTPDVGATGVYPTPAITVVVSPGSTTINSNSFVLSMDGTALATTVAPDGAAATNFDVTASVSTILDPASVHTLNLVYNDSLLGNRTNTWSFTVANFQQVTLPAPIYFENFDELVPNDVPVVPTGWSITNDTVVQVDNFDMTVPQSDTYLSFVVISSNTLSSVFNDSGTYSSPGLGSATGTRRLVHPPIELNGQLIDSLVHGNLAYCDSDQRQNDGGQVDVMFTKDYDLTGQTNIYVAFNSTYEQNQDNIGSVEYSIDQGATWLPALYMLDDGSTDGDGSDVVTNQVTGQIDVFATFGTARSDQAYNLAYSNFIGATVSTNLIPYIQGRRNDDPMSSKRIEVIRLPAADNQSHVRFRFGQAGTSSWYFGIDDFGLYSINTPVITTQPVSVNANAGTTVSFSVIATGSPLTYQWRLNGLDIAGATNSTYVITNAQVANVGSYYVIIGGSVKSSPANLTLNTTPLITSDLAGEIVDAGATLKWTNKATGGIPLTYILTQNGNPVTQNTNGVFTLSNLQSGNAGSYQLVVSNSYGLASGNSAIFRVWTGALASNLVVHLTFDGNLNDTSGRGNNGTYQSNGANANSSPTFAAGILGQAFRVNTAKDSSDYEYATLGYPLDLQFADTNDFSVCFWVNCTNQSDDIPFISNKDWDSSSNPGWGIFSQSGGNYRVNVTGPNGGADKYSQTDTPKVLKNGKWHHVAVSIQHAPFGQAAYIYGYLDGVLVSKHPMSVAGTLDTSSLALTDSQTSAPAPTPIQSQFAVNIGQDGTGLYTDNHGGNMTAFMDDLGIWRRAITASEVASIYSSGLNGKDLSQASLSSQLNIIVRNGVAYLTWGGSGTVKLQTATSLNPANWTDVPNTLGASSASVSVSGTAFFRLSQ